MSDLGPKQYILYKRHKAKLGAYDDVIAYDVSHCFLDDFLVDANPDINYLMSIISNEDPARPGLLEKLVNEKYGDMMYNWIIRLFRFAISEKSSVQLLFLRFIFVFMLSQEHAIQRIISYQLFGRKCISKLVFFEKYFMRYLRVCINEALNFPYYPKSIHWLFAAAVSHIQLTWSGQSTAQCRITLTFYERQLAERKQKEKEIQQKKQRRGRGLSRTQTSRAVSTQQAIANAPLPGNELATGGVSTRGRGRGRGGRGRGGRGRGAAPPTFRSPLGTTPSVKLLDDHSRDGAQDGRYKPPVRYTASNAN